VKTYPNVTTPVDNDADIFKTCQTHSLLIETGTFDVCGNSVLIGDEGLAGEFYGKVPLELVKQYIGGDAYIILSGYLPATSK
jgi:hypothetical protein